MGFFRKIKTYDFIMFIRVPKSVKKYTDLANQDLFDLLESTYINGSVNDKSTSLTFDTMSVADCKNSINRWLQILRTPTDSSHGEHIAEYSVKMISISTNAGIYSKDKQARANSIESSCFMSNMVPKKEVFEPFSYHGVNSSNITIDFNHELIIGEVVDAAAREMVSSDIFFKKHIRDNIASILNINTTEIIEYVFYNKTII